MSKDQSQRIDDALFSLIEKVIPIAADEDRDAGEERQENAFELAKSIIDRPVATATVSDVNYAYDLIKRRLIHESATPDKALRFSNLYSRLLNQPVLSQKSGILHMLNQLADTEQRGGQFGSSPSPSGQARDPRDIRIPELGEGYGHATSPSKTPFGRTSSLHESGPSLTSSQQAKEAGKGDWRRGTDGLKHVNGGSTEKVSDKRPGSAIKDHNMDPSEAALLRDLPFTLQGLSSTNLPFVSSATLTLPQTLPTPLISLLHTLAEPSLLYRGLSEFVQSSEGGLVGQSLRAAIGGELRSYLKLVATLEAEIRRALASLDDREPRGGIGKAGVTLKRCVVYTREATMGLRFMSLMVEESKSLTLFPLLGRYLVHANRNADKKGGQLISIVHGFSSSHGDPFVGAFAERLLSHVTRPFYDMLRQWIYDGELSDPHLEFFVSEQHAGASLEPTAAVDGRSRTGATSVWEDKYKLDDAMVPSIITNDFAKKIFLIGKSLNFIRYGCGDSAWVEDYSKEASKELRYGDTATLEASIDEAYKTTMARLTYLMDDKFKLFEHLNALKKYLLLGQGDFIALLMESLSSSLDRPANTLFRHSLTAQLEHAIRGSNAQYDSPDVLRRLDARMLMQGHGDIGWECFTLEYKIDAPVNVIVTPDGSRKYLKVFNFLWRVKRVEFALGSTWRRCMTGARGVLAVVADKVGRDWKLARCCVAEMIHFVCQLQYYILFEVIESSWDELQVAVSKPGATLDDLIGAHARYLEAITHKGLLGSSGARGGSSSSANKEDSFLSQLHEILKIMLAYKDAVDGLYSFSVAEFSRRQELSARIETRTAQGKWGITEADEDELRSPSLMGTDRRGKAAAGSKESGLLGSSVTGTPFAGSAAGEDQMLPTLGERLQSLSGDFRAKVSVLLGDLAYQPDVDMRFLGVVMNFNDVYQPVRRKKAKDREREREKKTPTAGAAAGTAAVDRKR
ncbi:MAG: Microtubule-nucleating Tub4p (gamma-tubulin) complex component [Sclerophora amabilis]|nr:MAG: Microtubule-nucleating Tub4p (gamma-tubulin) complex component [Sclerophora amabilis]